MNQSTTTIFSIIQLLYRRTYLNVAANLIHSQVDLIMTFSRAFLTEQGPHFSPHTQLNAMVTKHSSGKIVFNGISEVKIASIHPEISHLKKLMKKDM